MVITALLVHKKNRRVDGSFYATLMVYCGIYPVKTCAVKTNAKAANENGTANYMSINFVGWGSMNGMRGEIDMLFETFGE